MRGGSARGRTGNEGMSRNREEVGMGRGGVKGERARVGGVKRG